MKLGLGLYRHALSPENFRFARQCGCTHIVAHLVDYFKGAPAGASGDQPTGGADGWGYAGSADALWTQRELDGLVKQAAAEGLQIAAVENFDPAHWYDILLDGPRRSDQIEGIKTIIERVGRAGIPCIGYNFSLAGVAGRIRGPFARGGAEAVGVEGCDQSPIPHGMVWNMIDDVHAPEGNMASISVAELWRRVGAFLDDVLPTARRAGVVLALHPDDPPFATLRGTPRLVYQPELYQKLLDLNSDPGNQLEFCVGSVAEMTEGDVLEAVDRFSRQGKIAYVHLRNVRGKVPSYRETFIDDGDVDIIRVMAILKRNGFNGVVIPDHAPQLTCGAPWHAGMAYALGYMQAALRTI